MPAASLGQAEPELRRCAPRVPAPRRVPNESRGDQLWADKASGALGRLVQADGWTPLEQVPGDQFSLHLRVALGLLLFIGGNISLH
jgi:hypothetical protein